MSPHVLPGNTVHKVHNIPESDEVLQTANTHLYKEMAGRRLENEYLNACEDQLTKTRQKMYSMHHDTTKKVQRREALAL